MRLSNIEDLVTPRTATGALFHLVDPDQTEIRAIDITNRLPNTYRYQGDIPVSVLKHTVLGIRIINSDLFLDTSLSYVWHNAIVRRAFAKHDLHEVFAMEVPTGNKKHLYFKCGEDLISYSDLEAKWEKRVQDMFGVYDTENTDLCKDAVKVVDLLCLVIEMHAYHHAGYPYALEYVVQKYGADIPNLLLKNKKQYQEFQTFLYESTAEENLKELIEVLPPLGKHDFVSPPVKQ